MKNTTFGIDVAIRDTSCAVRIKEDGGGVGIEIWNAKGDKVFEDCIDIK